MIMSTIGAEEWWTVFGVWCCAEDGASVYLLVGCSLSAAINTVSVGGLSSRSAARADATLDLNSSSRWTYHARWSSSYMPALLK